MRQTNMTHVHIKNLEKYHPNYKDRELIWCKVYFSMMNGDPEFELLCEIDQWRFVKFIMLEIQSKKPVPIDATYLTRKGFDLKKRPISATIQMLHKFIEVCTETVTQSREEKSREEKIREPDSADADPTPKELFDLFKKTASKIPQPREFTRDRESKCRLRLRERGLAAWKEVFERMDKSAFLLGDNDRGWRASFDWIISNQTNAAKVLEGKYDQVKKTVTLVKNQPQPDIQCSACGGSGKLPDGVKCWCWK